MANEKLAKGKKNQLIIKDRELPQDEFMAAAVGDTKWLRYSLRDGHDPNQFDNQGLATIHIAAMHGRLECLKVLIEAYGVDVNLESEDGLRPLHLAINKKSGDRALECVKYLIKMGADVNCTDNDSTSALHRASSEGLADCVSLLLKEGADVECIDCRQNSALDLARIWGKRKCARILQNKLWGSTKTDRDQQRQKTNKMKQEFQQLQQEVLYQLMNEQEFFGNVSYTNWFEMKGFHSDPGLISTYTNKKQVDSLMAGLVTRLFANGTLKDIAARMEKLLQAYVKAAELKAISGLQTGILSKSESKKASKPVNYQYLDSTMYDGQGKFDKAGTFKPTGIYAMPRASYLERYVEVSPGMFKTVIPWNPSTNPNTFPATDIRNIESVSISIKPDQEQDKLSTFPMLKNITVEVMKNTDRIVLKLIGSGGNVEIVDVPVPFLPRDFLEATVFGSLMHRKSNRLPDIGCVHIYDVQRKRRPKAAPFSEMALHLKEAMEGYIFW